jgi:hypothetical protein
MPDEPTGREVPDPSVSYDEAKRYAWHWSTRFVKLQYRGVLVGIALAVGGLGFVLARYPEWRPALWDAQVSELKKNVELKEQEIKKLEGELRNAKLPAQTSGRTIDPKPPHWIADSLAGCWVWNEKPVANETVSWSGECVNKLVQGKGILRWFASDKDARDEGEWRDGKLNGPAKSRFYNGNRYEGLYRESLFHGRGKYTQADGAWLDGEWENGEFRVGKIKYAGGDFFEGEFNGLMYRRGKLTRVNGDWYDGEWLDDLPNGEGTGFFDGQSYSGKWTKGCFRDGKRTKGFTKMLECELATTNSDGGRKR